MSNSTLKLHGYRFTNNVKDLPEEEIQCRADRIAAYLSEPSHIGSFGMFNDFYNNGYVREMGFQYLADEPICILVSTARWERDWIVRYVTSRDPKIIDKFVQTYDGGEECSTRWVFFPKDVHYINS